MPTTVSPRATSRRALLRTAMSTAGFVLAGRYAFAASDFWNKKEPGEWSAQEIEAMKTKSPWAKKVRGEMGSAGGNRGGGMGGGGGSRGGGGRGGGGGSSDGGGFSAVAQGPEVVIRWENADPVLAATKFQLPPNLANHYALSVTGLPEQMLAMIVMGGGRGGGRGRGRDREGKAGDAPQAEAAPAAPPTPEEQAAQAKARQARLLNSVTLAAKGKDPQHADVALQTSDKKTLIFGFPKEILPLAASDKDVEFVMHAAMMTIKAKFEPKEMMFKGSLNV